MTYRHFSVAIYATSDTIRHHHGLQRVTDVSRAVAFVAFSARQPRLPRQPVHPVAGRAAPGTGNRIRAAGTRQAIRPADPRRRALRRARARDAGALAAPAAGSARPPGQA